MPVCSPRTRLTGKTRNKNSTKTKLYDIPNTYTETHVCKAKAVRHAGRLVGEKPYACIWLGSTVSPTLLNPPHSSDVKFGKELDEQDDNKQHILIRDLRPPFLDGKVVFTRQLDPINPVRDPTGDLATYVQLLTL